MKVQAGGFASSSHGYDDPSGCVQLAYLDPSSSWTSVVAAKSGGLQWKILDDHGKEIIPFCDFCGDIEDACGAQCGYLSKCQGGMTFYFYYYGYLSILDTFGYLVSVSDPHNRLMPANFCCLHRLVLKQQERENLPRIHSLQLEVRDNNQHNLQVPKIYIFYNCLCFICFIASMKHCIWPRKRVHASFLFGLTLNDDNAKCNGQQANNNCYEYFEYLGYTFGTWPQRWILNLLRSIYRLELITKIYLQFNS